MSSLITKVNKGRSSNAGKVRASKGKKAAAKKPARRNSLASSKPKKAAAEKSKKAAASSKKAKRAPSKTIAAKKKVAKTATTKRGGALAPRRSASAKASAKAARPVAKQPQEPTKKVPGPNTIAAVHAFEHALKAFNRQDFAPAKAAFEQVLKNFSDQAEIVARVRTYLAICDQRLARAPAVPRNPDALYDQGVFEFNKGNTRESIELFEKALRAEPRADHVLYSLAAAHARLHDLSRALDALRRAIAIRPVHRPHARRDLDFVSLRSNEEFQRLTGFGFDLIEE